MNPALSSDYFIGDLESVIFGGTPSLPPPKGENSMGDPKKMIGTYSFPGGASFEVRQANDGRLAIVTQDKRAMVLLRFPDAGAPTDSVPQDKIAADVIRAAAGGDFEPLRKVLAKEQPFEPLKFNFETAKQRLGELRGVSTVYQRWFVRNGAPEVQSFVRLEYEKGDSMRRVRHLPSGEITIEVVNMPPGVEGILIPTIGGRYAMWDFTLGNGAQIIFHGESMPLHLTVRGPHGSIVATKHSN
jgi:hypothetical protein